MRTKLVAGAILAVCWSAPSLGQTVLYWHPPSGSNADIDGMVNDMTSAGATVTTTCYENAFEKCLHSSVANSSPYGLVLVADETFDTYNDDVWDYLTAGNVILSLATQSNGDVLFGLFTDGTRSVQATNPVSVPSAEECLDDYIDCVQDCPTNQGYAAFLVCQSSCLHQCLVCLGLASD